MEIDAVSNESVLVTERPKKSAGPLNERHHALRESFRGRECDDVGDGNDQKPPPDGGSRAWLQVLMGHLLNINCWGYINSYGIFQAYYQNTLNLPASTVSWTGSVQIFFLMFIGAFSGRALDAGFYHHTLVAGCFLQLLGVFSVSFATRYWQIFLSQGICQGLGTGLIFCPTISLVSTYFQRRRMFAISLVACGGGTGGIIFPLLAQKLLPRLGFAWTIRIMGFVVLFNAVMVITLARTRLSPRPSGPFLERGAFKELPYLLFTIGTFFVLWPVYYAYGYINVFATSIIHTTSSTSLTILLIFNAVGIPGRIIPALLADSLIGPLNTFVLLCIICAFLIYVWLAVFSFSGLVAFAIIYGFMNAGVQGIFLGSVSSLTKDLKKMGTRVGMVLSVVSFACFTGAPIAGALIDRMGGEFVGVCIFGGTCMTVGSLILVGARAAETGWNWKRKV
ncbi:hypothetical protein EG329_009059 [Mollisiaceae sp. DMI_Dod_QoI]|nr:hypothetical protein EG329_009059 [Helotiales sp. DMI_Dod_QoI]